MRRSVRKDDRISGLDADHFLEDQDSLEHLWTDAAIFRYEPVAHFARHVPVQGALNAQDFMRLVPCGPANGRREENSCQWGAPDVQTHH